MSFNITIDALDWDDRVDSVVSVLGGENSATFRRAVRRAITNTVRWLRRQVARIAAMELGIAQKIFDKSRIRFRMERGDVLEGILWIGTNPFPAHRLGRVKWTRKMTGARAGRRTFPGTFAASHTGTPLIWRRSGRERLPIEIETVDIDTAIGENVRRLEAEALKRYRTLLAQSVNFELQKKLGRI